MAYKYEDMQARLQQLHSGNPVIDELNQLICTAYNTAWELNEELKERADNSPPPETHKAYKFRKHDKDIQGQIKAKRDLAKAMRKQIRELHGIALEEPEEFADI